MRRTSGFTLLELLTVLGCIAILVAILTPNLVSARNKSNDVASIMYLRSCITSIESIRDGLTGRLEVTPNTCNDSVLGDARQDLPDAVSSSVIEINSTYDSYLVTVTSKTGKIFKHDGHALVAGDG